MTGKNKENNIIDEIWKYYISPEKYAGDKSNIEASIKKLDDYLLFGTEEKGTEDLYQQLCKKCKESSYLPENIWKTLADDAGLSATRNYKEIYFNEIIQNANDNIDPGKSDSSKMEVVVSRENERYRMSFRYRDKGFYTSNIVGFFDTEIHTKKNDLAATGKHGVGIKSLFYFVEKLEIISNVKITVLIKKSETEDGQEKLEDVWSDLRRSEKWDGYTVLTIEFPRKESYDGKYNVGKLTDMLDVALEGNVSKLENYFFGIRQEELVFDVRGLLFTDKNQGKKCGIKEISFFRQQKKEERSLLFTLSCTEKACVEVPVMTGIAEVINRDGREGVGKDSADVPQVKKQEYCLVCQVELSLSSVQGRSERSMSFILCTLADRGKNEQNFSVAFPEASELKCGSPRYYETYYIPYEDNSKYETYYISYGDNSKLYFNILVNSRYSNVSRTKLADDDKELKHIRKEIKDSVIKVLKCLVSQRMKLEMEKGSYLEMLKGVSIIFHKMLNLDRDFVELCYETGISNRYLLKNTQLDGNRYLVYCREEKEKYEKKCIGQKIPISEAEAFVKKYILKEDSIRIPKGRSISLGISVGGSGEKFLEEVDKVYKKVFDNKSNDDDNYKYKLCQVLNVAGSVKDLIYYRIAGAFPEEADSMLTEKMIDHWNRMCYNEVRNSIGEEDARKCVDVSLMLIGRYGLHENISGNGEIISASFYNYIFAERAEGREEMQNDWTFEARAEVLYKDPESQKLKQRLRKGLVNQKQEDCQGEVFEGSHSGKEELCMKQNGYGCQGHTCFFTSRHRNTTNLYYCIDECKCTDACADTRQFGENLMERLLDLLTVNNCNNELTRHIRQIATPARSIENCLYFIENIWAPWENDPYMKPVYDHFDEKMNINNISVCSGSPFDAMDNEIAVRVKMIRLAFFKEVYVKNFEEFKHYFEAFEKLWEKGLFKCGVLLVTEYERGESMHMGYDSLSELFRFIHVHNTTDIGSTGRRYDLLVRSNEFRNPNDFRIDFKINLTGSLPFNLCEKDLFEFIARSTGKEVYAMQVVNRTVKEEELMYLYNGKICVVPAGHASSQRKSIDIGKYKVEKDKEKILILIYNDKFDSVEKAICKVLAIVDIGNQDIVDRCEAFLSSYSLLSVQGGEEYCRFTGRVNSVNDSFRHKKVGALSEKITCKCLKKLILARGNNDGKCVCCKKRISEQEGQLIITENQSECEELKKDYPQIYEVVCKDCRDMLRRSLRKSCIDGVEGAYTVSYHCMVVNAHQEKEVIIKSALYDGVAAVCRPVISSYS